MATRILGLLMVFSLVGCASTPRDEPGSMHVPSAAEVHVTRGYEIFQGGSAAKSIVEFEKAIDSCQVEHNHSERRIYSGRGPKDSLFYLLLAAAEEVDAVVIEPWCAEALYMKGHASLDLGQVDVAQEFVERAIAMAPMHSTYLSELGHIHHVKRDWEGAMEIFVKAEEAAESFSPDRLKTQELLRAMRGVGYSLVEMGDLDGAEAKFRDCLDVDEEDQRCRNELSYVEQLRNDGGEPD